MSTQRRPLARAAGLQRLLAGAAMAAIVSVGLSAAALSPVLPSAKGGSIETATEGRKQGAIARRAESQIEQLHARCVADMVARTCRAASGPAAPADASVTSVFVAGVGAIDARLYAELQQAGDAMCQHARRLCEDDWIGPRCRATRALYGLAQDG